MPIVVVAKSPEDYASWVKEQKAASPAAQVAAAAPAAAAPAEDPNKKWTADELKAMGEKLYAANCVACHQATGKGLPPAFPALDGSKVVAGPKDGQIAVLLKGRQGTAMASFARLTDTELAAVITYTRSSWGNKAGEVQPSDVKAARAKG
jgi:cytochrome c oxidase subunit 2